MGAAPPDPDQVRDTRIAGTRPLVSPALLIDELPLPEAAARVVLHGRKTVTRILNGDDDRLLVVVGPCSVHDPVAALDYARRLTELAHELRDRVFVVMRVYFEKPRSTLGWKGLLNDPRLDGSFQVNEGLRVGRRLLLDILALDLPAGCEFLDPITPQYIADTVSWGSIGARTAQSQVHRQLSSGMSMPIGVKNSTEGDVGSAVDAVAAAAASHVFTSVTVDGVAAIFVTRGNPDCHVILRGSTHSTNYDEASVEGTLARLDAAGLPRRLLIDASHGNSAKDHRRQPLVAEDVARQRAAGNRALTGLMLESFLVDGRQELVLGRTADLVYGRSVTDACLDWETTVAVLRKIAERR
ncbi:MAG: 3-deoxy-7-phosphoheptulonate synthase [Candidatus Dormibacteraeota bacterium]|nr:3-deoxy-7-phosphoheptulonate synthase [Candidatus Dormibacteraeota bacterium]MBO0760970.1 3-deoxy-7-phosphoheptulonate synthase [Candidatus Dormibacteraeota bacterium]